MQRKQQLENFKTSFQYLFEMLGGAQSTNQSEYTPIMAEAREDDELRDCRETASYIYSQIDTIEQWGEDSWLDVISDLHTMFDIMEEVDNSEIYDVEWAALLDCMLRLIVQIYQFLGNVADTNAKLFAAKAYLLLAHRLTNRTRSPAFFAQTIKENVTPAENILTGIETDYESDMKLKSLTAEQSNLMSVCCRLMMHGKIKMGEFQKAVAYGHKTIAYLRFDPLLPTEYFRGLALTYQSLSIGLSYDIEYTRIFQFGMNLFNVDKKQEVEFNDLQRICDGLIFNLNSASLQKIKILAQMLDLILVQIKDGVVEVGANGVQPANAILKSSFWRVMSEPYYQNRFQQIYQLVNEHKVSFTELASQPQLVFALQLQAQKQRELIQNLQSQIDKLKEQQRQNPMNLTALLFTPARANPAEMEEGQRPKRSYSATL